MTINARTDRLNIACLTRITLEHGVGGGMEQHTAEIVAGLQARGHRVTIITTAQPAGHPPPASGNTIFVPETAPGRYSPAWWRKSWAALQREHARQPFDVLISVSAGAQANLARARSALGLPSVVILHGTIGGDWQTRWRDRRSLRGVYRLVRYVLQVPGQWQRWRAVRQAVAAWIAVSHEVKADWQREMGIAADQIMVIPNGVDIARFAPDANARAATRASLDLAAETPLLMAVGRLEAEKGFHVAVHALVALRDQLPAARMLIVGEGVYRQQLQQLIAEHGLAERVMLAGYRPNHELPALLAGADLFLMPSLRYEGFPVTIVEALASGLPVLASRVGGIPSAIIDGNTGLLLPMGDVGAWAAAIADLLGQRRRCQAMGLLARQVAVARFSTAAMLDATEQVLLNVRRRGLEPY